MLHLVVAAISLKSLGCSGGAEARVEGELRGWRT